VNPAIPPHEWVVELCYYDKTWFGSGGYSTTIPGTDTSFDAYGAGWDGGYWIKLSGCDATGNLIYQPTLAQNPTINQ
jgi:hypothetical protein